MSRKRQKPIEDDEEHDSAPPKRARTFSERDGRLARLYGELADEVSDVRIAAAAKLSKELEPPAAGTDNSDPLTGNTVEKVLARLVRGLCSSRKAARFGFFVALSELLRQVYGDESAGYESLQLRDLQGFVAAVEELTKLEGESTKQDKRDHLLGRLLTYKAIIQSGVIFNANAAGLWADVLDRIFTLQKEVPWLREECGMILCDAVKSLKSTSVGPTLALTIINGLSSNGLARTAEGVAVWLTTRSSFLELHFPSKVWHKNDPLSKKEWHSTAKALLDQHVETGDGSTGKDGKKKGGSWQPNPNFAWTIVLNHLFEPIILEQESPDTKTLQTFRNAWSELIDNTLFSLNASPERKSWGFKLFSWTFNHAPAVCLAEVFSANLMRTWTNQLTKSDRQLHELAKEVVQKVKSRAKKEPLHAAQIAQAILANRNDDEIVLFDHITKTKLVEDILAYADDDSLTSVIVYLARFLRRPTKAGEVTESAIVRQVITDMCLNFIRAKATPEAQELSWIDPCLRSIADMAHYKAEPSQSSTFQRQPEVSEETRKMARGRLSSILAHLLAQQPIWLAKNIGTALPDPRNIQSPEALESSNLIFQADDAVLGQLRQAYKTLRKMSKMESEDASKKSMITSFQLLFGLTILQVFSDDPDAVSMLEELDLCYQSAFQKSTSTDKGVDLLIEIVLSFTAKSSALCRKLGEQVFGTFAHNISSDGLHSLLDILQKKENLEGQQDLFDRQEDEDEDDDEDDEDEDSEAIDDLDASDVEIIDASDASGSEGDSEANGDESSLTASDEDEEDDTDTEALLKLDAVLAETLGTAKPKLNGSNEDDDTSDSDADMNDDEMMALEPHLTKIFKERKAVTEATKKKEAKDAKENMINFKNRILDLLNIFVKQEYANLLTIDILVPCLELIRTTTAPHLANKANEILKTYINNCNKQKTYPEPENDSEAWDILSNIHNEAKRNAPNMHGAACSRASLFVMKIMTIKDAGNFDVGADIYSDTLKDSNKLGANNHIKPQFFTEWISWSFERKKAR